MRQRWAILYVALLVRPAISRASEVLAENKPPAAESAPTQDHLSLAEYQARLKSLEEQVAACQKSASNCSSEKVGHDLTVDLPGGPRQVSLGWLRTILDQASHPNPKPPAGPPPPAAPKPGDDQASHDKPSLPSIAQQLESARRRLVQDQHLALAPPTGAQSPARDQLTQILAAPEYHTAANGRSIKDRVLEKIANWLDSVIGALVRAGSKSKWIGLSAEIGFVALLAVGLVWFLIRLERQARFGLSSLGAGTSIGAASERDWRLWAEDARQAAAQGAWREAIHSLYWSNISRLESSGLWPADRARTPREYLVLLAQKGTGESTQQSTLTALTRNFERTWYAGHDSSESDYREAQEQAANLSANLAAERGRGAPR